MWTPSVLQELKATDLEEREIKGRAREERSCRRQAPWMHPDDDITPECSQGGRIRPNSHGVGHAHDSSLPRRFGWVTILEYKKSIYASRTVRIPICKPTWTMMCKTLSRQDVESITTRRETTSPPSLQQHQRAPSFPKSSGHDIHGAKDVCPCIRAVVSRTHFRVNNIGKCIGEALPDI